MLAFALMFLLGACFGSFVTLASYRLPRDENIATKRSQCPQCHTPLAARDLMPILSWVVAKGRCRHCQCRVSIRYPLIEVLLGGLFVWLYARYGLTLEWAVLALFTTALLTLIVADLETGLIPDSLHLFLLPLGVAYHWLQQTDPAPILICTGVALSLGLMLHYGYFWLRGKHGLGFGDVKFLAVIGLWLGDIHVFVAFLVLSGLLGVATGLLWKLVSREERFPFGPALAIGLFLLVIFPGSDQWFWESLRQLLHS